MDLCPFGPSILFLTSQAPKFTVCSFALVTHKFTCMIMCNIGSHMHIDNSHIPLDTLNRLYNMSGSISAPLPHCFLMHIIMRDNNSIEWLLCGGGSPSSGMHLGVSQPLCSLVISLLCILKMVSLHLQSCYGFHVMVSDAYLVRLQLWVLNINE